MDPNVILVTGLPNSDLPKNNIETDNYFRLFADISFSSNGVAKSAFIPTRNINNKDGNATLDVLLTDIVGQFRDDRLNLIGVSMYTQDAQFGIRLANVLKSAIPRDEVDMMIVGGGSLLYRNRQSICEEHVPDSIDFILAQTTNNGRPIFDGVVFGGLGAFIDLYEQLRAQEFVKGDIILPNRLPKGYYVRDMRGLTQGQGISGLSQMSHAPFKIEEVSGRYALTGMFQNVCQNHCDFCRPGVSFRFTEEQVRKGVKIAKSQILGHDEVTLFYLTDPNPFTDKNRVHAINCLEVVNSEFRSSPWLVVFYDSGLFMILIKYLLTCINIG